MAAAQIIDACFDASTSVDLVIPRLLKKCDYPNSSIAGA
jgi:hypothetical protein